VELIKKTLKIYPYQPGGFGTSIATALYRPSYRKEAAEDAWQRCCLSGIKS
jgi:dienelactone hydrolase